MRGSDLRGDWMPKNGGRNRPNGVKAGLRRPDTPDKPYAGLAHPSRVRAASPRRFVGLRRDCEYMSGATGQASPSACPTVTGSSAGPDIASPTVRKPNAPTTMIQCRRCLHTLELPAETVGRYVRCDKCRRQLKMPRTIRHACAYCGCHGEYAGDASGRRVKCKQCGVRVLIPLQVARPTRHRHGHHRSHGRQSSSDSGMIPLLVSLGITLVVLIMCFRFVSSL